MPERDSLVLAAGLPFDELRQRLAEGGWAELPSAAVTAPILPGEPELAQWRLGEDGPLLTYTFNPAARLRVLRLAGDPLGEHHAALAAELPTLETGDLERSLAAAAPDEVLRAVLAAAELEAVSLAGEIGLAAGNTDPAVSEAAARVHLDLLHLEATRLAGADDPRRLAATLNAISGNAMPLLAALAGASPGEVLSLQPTEEDCAAAFTSELAGLAHSRYAKLWTDPPQVDPGPARTDLQVRACPAGLFASDNLFSQAFPGGYRRLATYLRPGRVWLAWRYVRPGSRSGLAMDGLVHARGEWVWFPKPFRLLDAAAETGG